MDCYELIKANESLLQILMKNQINVNDIEDLCIYEEFRAMKKRDHKTTYCVAVLGDKYGKSQRTIYNIINHFRAKIEL